MTAIYVYILSNTFKIKHNFEIVVFISKKAFLK